MHITLSIIIALDILVVFFYGYYFYLRSEGIINLRGRSDVFVLILLLSIPLLILVPLGYFGSRFLSGDVYADSVYLTLYLYSGLIAAVVMFGLSKVLSWFEMALYSILKTELRQPRFAFLASFLVTVAVSQYLYFLLEVEDALSALTYMGHIMYLFGLLVASIGWYVAKRRNLIIRNASS